MYLPECAACGKIFDDGSHAPRILMCGHTVCEFCLEQLLICGPIEPSFTCLECRTVSQWHHSKGLPKNFAILGAFKGVPCAESADGKPSKLWKIPSNYLIPALQSTTCQISESIERKVQEIRNILGISLAVLFCAPVLCIHTCVSCFTAGLGFLVLSWSSIGGVGLGLGMLFLWWTRNLFFTLYRFGKFLFRFPYCAQKSDLRKIHRERF